MREDVVDFDWAGDELDDLHRFAAFRTLKRKDPIDAGD